MSCHLRRISKVWGTLAKRRCDLRLLDVTCCAGSIPSELGKLSALQSLQLSSNKLSGESNLCLGVSETFVVSDGGYVSNGINVVEKEKMVSV